VPSFVRWCAPGKIVIDSDKAEIDLSNLVMGHGRGFVKERDVCFLCGSTKGLKEPCCDEECHCADTGHNSKRPCFHPTCARQAGLEVKDDSSMDEVFYGEFERILVPCCMKPVARAHRPHLG
jgi:hypothetical protein